MSTRTFLSLVAAALLVGPSFSNAQVVVANRGSETSMRTNVFGLGFAGGPATGLGLSFRHHLPSPFSYQLIGGIIKATDRLYYSVGTEFQYDLSRTSVIRFYAAGGLSYYLFRGLRAQRYDRADTDWAGDGGGDGDRIGLSRERRSSLYVFQRWNGAAAAANRVPLLFLLGAGSLVGGVRPVWVESRSVSLYFEPLPSPVHCQ